MTGPPVPMSTSYRRGGHSFDLGAGRASRETFMRTYSRSGTVFAIVSLLAAVVGIAGLASLQVGTADGRVRYTTADHGTDQRTEVVQHAALTLWNKPNDFHTGFEFREGANQHLELTGETFWVMNREVTTFPTSMWYVRPDRMEPVPDPDDFLLGWMYTGPNGEQVPLKLDEVILEKTPDPLDPFRGCSPVASLLSNIDQQKYAIDYMRNLFQNGAEPDGIVQVGDTTDRIRLTDPEYDEFTERWRESHQGISRAGRVGLLENGMTWIPNAHSNRDLEYGNLRLANRDELREGWRIHKAMLGTVEDVNRANAQTAEEVHVAWQTIPRLERRKDTLNSKLLPMFGSTGVGVEFDYEDPSPDNREEDNGELTAKTAAFAVLIGAGVDPDDAAEVVGLPSMDMVEQATQLPALPPAWVPAAPAGEPAPGGSDDMENLLRRAVVNLNGVLDATRKRVPVPQLQPAKAWIADGPDPCATCKANADDGAIPVGEAFESGDMEPPAHPHCECGLSKTAMKHTGTVRASGGLASGDEMADLFRRVLSDGYVPVEMRRR